ncbi:MAG: hypothetical protein A3D31_03625 [Candidatus Fluviicola riflensis]|nr:MAG: hypothetical protein CHH17_11405 [Candidatus Fluviicola riflensis]OGS79067.1 MAG: hypothetical protein A3D31_03625 [Candidatus Fluviicola riflensis]OGS86090.1 MAG: hypothetical protein A3E30_11115 [Fluviicola sp. RIFCSPHIGHO2_12_FULL_43_24]OGS86499.1 MAG: hypothetical protein A2724_03085 [Fluviicola sp. RIFCSPHIGHO2_01_FULL_43_53]
MPNETNNPTNRFAAKSHFFSEVANVSQSVTQTFGPVSEDVFRLTSKFTATAGTKAFAICPGIVAIQPQTGSPTKVNLILRPYQQPIKGVNIRYFIYRGLNKSDFIDPSGNIIPITSGVSDFITKINTDFFDFHADEEEPPVFDSAFIGYQETVAEMTASFENLFFSLTQYDEEGEEVPETAFELPKIDQGKTLGTFATGECGIDVVLNYGDYILNEPDRFAFDYNYARAAEALIDLSAITDEVVLKRRKEQIFQFIDIAAFYGFHCIAEGKVTTVGDVEHDQSTIYSNVLTSFASKNTYYLYIQSDRERSYDFYGNYRIDAEEPENHLYGTEENTLTARVYGTDGWPLILETTVQEHAEERNKIYLQLVTDNNSNVVLYGQTACVDNALRNHFSTIEELKQPVDEEDNQPILTNTIILSNPAVEDGSVKKHIANFGILIYQGATYSYIAGTELNEEEEEVNVYAQPNAFDDVFGNLVAVPLLITEESKEYKVVNFERLHLLKHVIQGQLLGVTAFQTTQTKDTIFTMDPQSPLFNRVVYSTSTIAVANSPLSPTSKIASDIQTPINTSADQKTFELPRKTKYELGVMTVESGMITTIKLPITDGFVNRDLIIGISKAENDSVNLLCEGLINPRIVLSDLSTNKTSFVSSEGINYFKYVICVVGENQENGNLVIVQPEESVFIYSLDKSYFFSKTYSDNMIQMLDTDLIMNYDPSFLINLETLE